MKLRRRQVCATNSLQHSCAVPGWEEVSRLVAGAGLADGEVQSCWGGFRAAHCSACMGLGALLSLHLSPTYLFSSGRGLSLSRVALSVTWDCHTKFGARLCRPLVCTLVWHLAETSPVLPERGLSSSPVSLGRVREQRCVHMSFCFRDLPIT